MSHWNIAAAQYGGQHQSVDDHVTHHLRFIAEAARQRCDLLVFPELSLTGSGTTTLPLPTRRRAAGTAARRGASLPDNRYCRAPLERNGQRQKGLALFTPARHRILRYPQGGGASLVPGINSSPSLMRMPIPPISIPGNAVYQLPVGGDNRWRQSISTLQRFAHKYAIAVLMANACGGSALWDEKGQLIVRADKGELLLTGTLGGEGWQGDIIPLG
jgi:predicted amidohydrolase